MKVRVPEQGSEWRHYAEYLMAPLCRIRNDSIAPNIHTAQLQDEAHVRINAVRAGQAEQEKRHADALAAAQRDAAQWRDQAQQPEAALHAERERQRETIARHTSEQQAAELRAFLDGCEPPAAPLAR